MKLSDFDFELPEELIALHPAEPRPASRLLVSDGGRTTLAHVVDLGRFLRAGDLLVFNDTRVLPARLDGVRRRGDLEAKVEVTLSKERADGAWEVMARPARKLRHGDAIRFGDALSAEVVEDPRAGIAVLRFRHEGPFLEALAQVGVMPLPPYIAGRRAPEAADRERYQTVFARVPGAVAAPTASLHFDDALLAGLAAQGIGQVFVTLHVGIGTFLPVKVENIDEHRMHSEWGEITPEAAAAINAARTAGGRIIPVGTTALRLIESAAEGGVVRPFVGETDIFIRPGYEFQVTDGLMTNFHLPRSTLLMLVAALIGRKRMFEIYAEAIEARMRFFSYGDSSLLLP